MSINSKATEDENVKGSFFWWINKSNTHYNLYNKKHTFDDTGAKKYRAHIDTTTKDVLMVNYESLYQRTKDERSSIVLKENIEQFINSCKGQKVCLIIDESHNIKTSNSNQTIAVKKIKQLLDIKSSETYTYLLTGTPFTCGFEDLYTQLSLIGLPMNKGQFFDAFCVRGNIPTLMPWQQPIVGYKNIDSLFKLVHKYGITIKSEDVLTLPEQIFVDHCIPESKYMKLFTAQKLKAEIINEELCKRNLSERVETGISGGKVNNPFFRNIAYPKLNWIADTAAACWMRARQLSIGFQGNEEEMEWYDKCRLAELEKLLTEHEDNYILFYNYTPEFIELYELCDRLGYKIDVYNGLFKTLRYYEEFSELSDGEKLTDKKRIILSNFESGSTGKNWQEYNKCILFSMPLFSEYEQGIKRVHRPGQKHTVIYHRFYQNNWLDSKMMEALNNKREYDKNMFEFDFKTVQSLIEK